MSGSTRSRSLRRVALDGTPLLGARTGVGRYVEQLVQALRVEPTAADVELRLVPLTWRGAAQLATVTPDLPGVRATHRRVPARLLREVWARTNALPAESLSGAVDVWHGTNFVLPPTRRAGGVVTVHDLTYLRHPEWVTADVLRYRDLVPTSLRRASAICTPSATVRDELLEAYPSVSPERVFATPLCVDQALFDATPPDQETRRSLGLPQEYLLFLGATEPRKGLATLLAAYRLLEQRAAGVPPLLVVGPAGWGDSPDFSGLPAGRVVTAGYRPASQLPQIVAGAAALVYPSRYEGFGLPPLEAFAAGVPAVVSDLPVCREVLGDLAVFASIDSDDAVDALAAAIVAVLAQGPDDGRARRREHAATFTQQNLAISTMRAYRAALS